MVTRGPRAVGQGSAVPQLMCPSPCRLVCPCPTLPMKARTVTTTSRTMRKRMMKRKATSEESFNTSLNSNQSLYNQFYLYRVYCLFLFVLCIVPCDATMPALSARLRSVSYNIGSLRSMCASCYTPRAVLSCSYCARTPRAQHAATEI